LNRSCGNPYKLKLKELARALERELGLRIVGSARAPDAGSE
jgi:hypothetical protein